MFTSKWKNSFKRLSSLHRQCMLQTHASAHKFASDNKEEAISSDIDSQVTELQRRSTFSHDKSPELMKYDSQSEDKEWYKFFATRDAKYFNQSHKGMDHYDLNYIFCEENVIRRGVDSFLRGELENFNDSQLLHALKSIKETKEGPDNIKEALYSRIVDRIINGKMEITKQILNMMINHLTYSHPSTEDVMNVLLPYTAQYLDDMPFSAKCIVIRYFLRNEPLLNRNGELFDQILESINQMILEDRDLHFDTELVGKYKPPIHRRRKLVHSVNSVINMLRLDSKNQCSKLMKSGAYDKLLTKIVNIPDHASSKLQYFLVLNWEVFKQAENSDNFREILIQKLEDFVDINGNFCGGLSSSASPRDNLTKFRELLYSPLVRELYASEDKDRFRRIYYGLSRRILETLEKSEKLEISTMLELVRSTVVYRVFDIEIMDYSVEYFSKIVGIYCKNHRRSYPFLVNVAKILTFANYQHRYKYYYANEIQLNNWYELLQKLIGKLEAILVPKRDQNSYSRRSNSGMGRHKHVLEQADDAESNLLDSEDEEDDDFSDKKQIPSIAAAKGGESYDDLVADEELVTFKATQFRKDTLQNFTGEESEDSEGAPADGSGPLYHSFKAFDGTSANYDNVDDDDYEALLEQESQAQVWKNHSYVEFSEGIIRDEGRLEEFIRVVNVTWFLYMHSLLDEPLITHLKSVWRSTPVDTIAEAMNKSKLVLYQLKLLSSLPSENGKGIIPTPLIKMVRDSAKTLNNSCNKKGETPKELVNLDLVLDLGLGELKDPSQFSQFKGIVQDHLDEFNLSYRSNVLEYPFNIDFAIEQNRKKYAVLLEEPRKFFLNTKKIRTLHHSLEEEMLKASGWIPIIVSTDDLNFDTENITSLLSSKGVRMTPKRMQAEKCNPLFVQISPFTIASQLEVIFQNLKQIASLTMNAKEN